MFGPRRCLIHLLILLLRPINNSEFVDRLVEVLKVCARSTAICGCSRRSRIEQRNMVQGFDLGQKRELAIVSW
jgi:hypothetical protein